MQLARVDERMAHLLHVRGESPLSRLRGTGVTARVPQALAVVLAVQRGRAAWLLPGRRAAARGWAAGALPGADAATRERLARAHLVELATQSELYWHTAKVATRELEGAEHLDAALRRGRGAIVAFPHVGPVTALPVALATRRGRAYTVRRADIHAGVVEGAVGRWMRFQREVIEDAGVRLVTRGGAFATLTALLRRGDVVAVAWDVGGKTPVRHLGQAMDVSGGVAALVGATGVAVVPGIAFRDRWRVRVQLAPALEGPPETLVQQLADHADAHLRRRLPQAHEHLLRIASGKQ